MKFGMLFLRYTSGQTDIQIMLIAILYTIPGAKKAGVTWVGQGHQQCHRSIQHV